MRAIVGLLVLCITAQAENVLTVCPSGCTYSSVQTAVNAAPAGSIIELKAGEIFTENLVVIGKRNLRFRTSRWRELPATGYRIDPVAHAPLLATIRTNNSEPAMSIGAIEDVVVQNGVDTAADTISFDYVPAHSAFVEGSAVSCLAFIQNNGSMPAPLIAGQKYWIRDWNVAQRKGRLSETPNGPPIDLISAGSADSSNYYGRPQCVLWDQSRQLVFQGIRFETSAAAVTYTLVQVGHNLEPRRKEMGPAEIEFRHTVISGVPENPSGPLIGITLNGSDLIIRDSWIGNCKRIGEESKAIAAGNVTAATIVNNYLSAASINLLTGGGDSAAMEVNRDLVITGNFFEKPGYMMYKEGAGAPTGECYYGGGSGAFYRRTDTTPNSCANGACYSCTTGNSWQLDTNAFYRNGHYLTKNMLELKDCENCKIEGNFLRGGYAGPDPGQGWCFGISAIISPPGYSGGGSGYHHVHDVIFRNNWADYCYSGVFLTHSSYGGTYEQIPMRNIVVENNLLTNLGWAPAMTHYTDPDSVLRFGIKQTTGVAGLRFRNNTLRARSDYRFGVLLIPGTYPDRTMRDYLLENNLMSFQSYSFFLDSHPNACTAEGLFQWIPNDGYKHLRNNVLFGATSLNSFIGSPTCDPIAENTLLATSDANVGFMSADNHRLASSSLYSAANPNAVVTSTNSGDDLGADVDAVEQYAIPARNGEPSMPEQMRLNIVSGSSAALLRFIRPEGSSCQVTLYNGPRITANEFGDTNTAAEKQSDRPSSLVNGRAVVFVAGAYSALGPGTAYRYRIDCGSKWAVGVFKTNPAGYGALLSRQLRHATAAGAQIEYSSSQDFTSSTLTGTAGFSNGRSEVTVAMPSGYRYWRWRLLDSGQNVIQLGPTELFIAP